MKYDWLNKQIREAKGVKMSVAEKKGMLSRILGSSAMPSPYYFYASPVVREYHKQVISFAIILTLIVTSGGTSFAAENALPGEALYSIKVNVNEEIKNFVALSASSKAKFSVERTSKRLDEAEELSKQGKLNAETQAILETNIQKHKESIKENIAVLVSENATTTVQEVVSDLSASIEMHEQNLVVISSSTESTQITGDHINELLITANEVKEEIKIIGESVNGTTTPNTASSTDPVIDDSVSTSTSSIDTPVTGTTTATSSSVIGKEPDSE